MVGLFHLQPSLCIGQNWKIVPVNSRVMEACASVRLLPLTSQRKPTRFLGNTVFEFRVVFAFHVCSLSCLLADIYSLCRQLYHTYGKNNCDHQDCSGDTTCTSFLYPQIFIAAFKINDGAWMVCSHFSETQLCTANFSETHVSATPNGREPISVQLQYSTDPTKHSPCL